MVWQHTGLTSDVSQVSPASVDHKAGEGHLPWVWEEEDSALPYKQTEPQRFCVLDMPVQCDQSQSLNSEFTISEEQLLMEGKNLSEKCFIEFSNKKQNRGSKTKQQRVQTIKTQ